MMTPDRKSCRGVMSRQGPCKFAKRISACSGFCVESWNDVRLFVLSHLAWRENRVAEIPTHRGRWCAWIDRPLLDWIDGGGTDGHAFPVWDVCHQSYGLPRHRVFAHLLKQAGRSQPGMAGFVSCGVYWRLQHLFVL